MRTRIHTYLSGWLAWAGAWGCACLLAAAQDADSVNQKPRPRPAGVDRDSVVSFFKDAELKAGDTAQDVVVIIGSAKVKGDVREDVVAICGDVEVDSEVKHDVVAVLGSVKVGKNASIGGDVVAVGGTVETAEGAVWRRKPVEVDFGGIGPLPKLARLREWVVQCALKLRPLSPTVGWIWTVDGVFLMVYLLVAAVFRKPVQACVNQLNRRPATTLLFGLLTKLLVPLVSLLLAITGIGIIVLPFISIAVLLFAVVGKVALMESLGEAFGRQLGEGAWRKPVVAFLMGWVVVTLFYMIPVLGLMTYITVGMWGLGVALTAAFGSMNRELPASTPPSTGMPGSPPVIPVVPGGAGYATAPASSLFPGAAAQAGAAVPPTSAPFSPSQAASAHVPEAFAFPRAGFWERLAAAFLDCVLLVLLACLAHPLMGAGRTCPVCLVLATAYFTGMWAWKGMTIGGIVLNLKVVRMDASPLTFSVALVRVLSAFFAAVVLFLGFFWIAWDRDKQGWHDKIAGTVVLRVPRGTSLVCL